MSTYTAIDGNPSETVGDTRIVSAEESSDSIRIRAIPRSALAVLGRRLESHHVLISLFASFGLEGVLAIFADTLLPSAYLGIVFGVALGTTLLAHTVVYFAVVHSDDPDDDGRDGSPLQLTVDPESFELTKQGLFGRRTLATGKSWELARCLERLNRAHIALSTHLVSTLRPSGSLRAFLVAGLTDGDRRWLATQLETEAS